MGGSVRILVSHEVLYSSICIAKLLKNIPYSFRPETTFPCLLIGSLPSRSLAGSRPKRSLPRQQRPVVISKQKVVKKEKKSTKWLNKNLRSAKPEPNWSDMRSSASISKPGNGFSGHQHLPALISLRTRIQDQERISPNVREVVDQSVT